MAAEWSWSARARASRSRFRDFTHQADDVSLAIGNGRDPYLAPIHSGNDVGFFDAGGPRGFYLRVRFFDVAYVVEEHRVLLLSVLALGFGAGEHQSHSSAIEEGKGGWGIEKVRQSERVAVESRGFLDVADGHRDLLDALESGSRILRHSAPLARSLAQLTMCGLAARRKSRDPQDADAEILLGWRLDDLLLGLRLGLRR